MPSRGPRDLAATLGARARWGAPDSDQDDRRWVDEAGPKPWYNHQMIQDVAALKLGRRDCRTGRDSTYNITGKI